MDQSSKTPRFYGKIYKLLWITMGFKHGKNHLLWITMGFKDGKHTTFYGSLWNFLLADFLILRARGHARTTAPWDPWRPNRPWHSPAPAAVGT